MQHAQTWLHAHLHVPSKYRLSLIPVDSGCTVTNIDHGSIIHADHRMSASRPICVASKDSDAIYPDYEGYGQIMTFSNFGQIKKHSFGPVRARIDRERSFECLGSRRERPQLHFEPK